MTPNQYVGQILQKYRVLTGPFSPAAQAANAIAPEIRQWAGTWLHDLSFSGSYAKGTAVAGATDIDLFISLKPSTPDSLSKIYNKLFNLASSKLWLPRRQEVSIGIQYLGRSIDLVPAKVQTGFQNYHSLYRKSTGTWTQTNIALHVNTVVNSKRTEEIRAIKIWRNLRGLDFPSIYLELTVINALKYRPIGALADNVLHAFGYIANSLQTARVIDPANTNNVISNDLSLTQKRLIATKASESTRAQSWGQIIW